MRLLLLCILILTTSCGVSQKTDTFQLAKEFYERAKEKESEIGIFFNVLAEGRGIDPIDSTYSVLSIDVKLHDSIITIPGIKSYMSDEQIRQLPFFENISKLGKLSNLPPSAAYDSIKHFSIEIISLMDELKAFAVHGSPHKTGEFIIFNVTSEYDVVFVPDEQIPK